MRIPFTFFLVLASVAAFAEHKDAAVSSHRTLNETGSEMIDRLFQGEWLSKNITPAPRAEDWEFLRRSSLDFLGRLPLPDEYQKFFGQPADQRQALWCDRVGAHPDLDGYWATFWRESLVENFDGAVNSPLEEALKKGLGNWKQLASDVLEGPVSMDFRARLRGDAVERVNIPKEGQFNMVPATSAAAKVFLGTSLRCAQCHDHPFEPYAQEEFWGISAHLRNVKGQAPLTVTYPDPDGNQERAVRSYFGSKSESFASAIFRAKPKSLATAITEDPRFARAIVSQVWGQIFGQGLNAPNPPSEINDPTKEGDLTKVVDALAAKFRESGYDQKALMSWICKSKVYALSSAGPSDPAASHFFAKAPTKPLTGPQFMRSMAGLKRLSRGKAGELGGQPFFEGAFTTESEVRVGKPVNIQTFLFMLNSPLLQSFLKGYWDTTLKANPQMSKTEAVQSASRLLLGKDMPEPVLKTSLKTFPEALSPGMMSEVSTQLMSTSFFLQNR